jgi:hypothetical protein
MPACTGGPEPNGVAGRLHYASPVLTVFPMVENKVGCPFTPIQREP